MRAINKNISKILHKNCFFLIIVFFYIKIIINKFQELEKKSIRKHSLEKKEVKRK
jgi:preprotein translocase subunit SecG